MKHKNAEVICAWVNGVTVQHLTMENRWKDAPAATKLIEGDNFLEPHPIHPDYDHLEWRVKP